MWPWEQFTIDERWLWGIGCVLGTALLLALVLGAYVLTRIRRINLPPDADPLTALRMTPLSVVILLDLLDLSLDFMAAPFAWALLGRLGLGPLRGVTVVESLIPGTQAIPTMTLAWIAARVLRPDTRATTGRGPTVIPPRR
jgi:hypothetical protein